MLCLGISAPNVGALMLSQPMDWCTQNYITLRYIKYRQIKHSSSILLLPICVPITGWPGDDSSVLEETVVALMVEIGGRASVERLWVMGIGDEVMMSGTQVEVEILRLVVTSLVNIINVVGVIEI